MYPPIRSIRYLLCPAIKGDSFVMTMSTSFGPMTHMTTAATATRKIAILLTLMLIASELFFFMITLLSYGFSGKYCKLLIINVIIAVV